MHRSRRNEADADDRERDAHPCLFPDPLDAANATDQRDESRCGGDEQRCVAGARSRDAENIEELVDTVAEHTEADERERDPTLGPHAATKSGHSAV